MTTTLLVARHGEADYDHPGEFNDDGGWLTALGREQATALGERLRDRGVAAVYSSTLFRAVETGRIAAERLGVADCTEAGLHEFPAGDLTGRREGDPEVTRIYEQWLSAGPEAPIPGGAETGREVLARLRAGLESIAARHRDETVLVISHGGVMSYALPRLAGNVADDLAGRGYFPNCAVVEVVAAEDGFAIASWPPMAEWPAPAVEPPPG